MSPGGHLVTTALACGAVYAATGSPALTTGLAAGGFLIDVDHALDYLLLERQRDLRPAAFLRYYLSGRTRRVVLVLHSYELMALLLLVAWATNWAPLWGYVLGAGLHLPLDIVFNGKVVSRNLVPFYSFLYRWRAGFRASALMGARGVAPASPAFWGAFFKGAAPVPAGMPARALEARPPASPLARRPQVGGPTPSAPRLARVPSELPAEVG